MIATYFVLTLYCLTCQPLQVLQVHDIPAFTGGSAQWADMECKFMGDVLSGDYERRNMQGATMVGKITARKDLIVYTCKRESDWF